MGTVDLGSNPSRNQQKGWVILLSYNATARIYLFLFMIFDLLAIQVVWLSTCILFLFFYIDVLESYAEYIGHILKTTVLGKVRKSKFLC